MAVSEPTEVISWRRRLIVMDIFDYEEASEYGCIDNYGAALDEEDESDLGEAVVITGLTEVGGK